MEYEYNYVLKSRGFKSREEIFSPNFLSKSSFSSPRRTKRLTKSCNINVYFEYKWLICFLFNSIYSAWFLWSTHPIHCSLYWLLSPWPGGLHKKWTKVLSKILKEALNLDSRAFSLTRERPWNRGWEPLRGSKILFSARGLKFVSPLKRTNSKRTHYLVSAQYHKRGSKTTSKVERLSPCRFFYGSPPRAPFLL